MPPELGVPGRRVGRLRQSQVDLSKTNRRNSPSRSNRGTIAGERLM